MDLDPFSTEELTVDTTIRTRCGYAIADAIHSFKMCLEQSGSVAAGKCLHYSADLITSGAFDYWQKILWDFAFEHVGIASPRIFSFLNRRFQELEAIWAKLPAEAFYKSVENQKLVAECVLVLRSCPRKPPLKMPRVPPETHSNEWVQQSLGTGDVSLPIAVTRVYKAESDLMIVRKVAKEFVVACEQGATEKAFFWLKWLFEEESFLKKEKQRGLCLLERGPSDWPSKARAHVGFFFADLLAEIYKDLMGKGLLRMNEEFAGLLYLYRVPNKKLSQRRRLDALCLCIQILCEAPKWKVPAAPTLVADPVSLERAKGHAPHFFNEVLAYAPPKGDIAKEAKKVGGKATGAGGRRLTSKEKEKLKQEQQMTAYNDVINKMLGIS